MRLMLLNSHGNYTNIISCVLPWIFFNLANVSTSSLTSLEAISLLASDEYDT